MDVSYGHNAKVVLRRKDDNHRLLRSGAVRISSHASSETLHEEEENTLLISQDYSIRSKRSEDVIHQVKTTQPDNTANPTVNGFEFKTAENRPVSEYHCTATSEFAQQMKNTITNNTQLIHSSNSQTAHVRKPRPNSLAIVSLSNDLNGISLAVENSSHFNQEANSTSKNPGSNNKVISNVTAEQGEHTTDKSAPPERPLGPRPSLQQRRNVRPTSLLIPNLPTSVTNPVKTAHQFSSNVFSFTGHSPVVRQRSYSMPSGDLIELKNEKLIAKHTLDEILNLINKKKLNKEDIDQQNILHRAADSGHVKLAKKCIQAGCSINKKLENLNGISALHCAVRADKKAEEMTGLLLQHGIDVNAKNDLGETPIFSAVIHKQTGCIDLLMQHGCDINAVWQQSTPLYLTLINKDLESTTKLIHKGANVTKLLAHIRQPFHAVLELCHSQPVNQKLVDMLDLIVKADGNAVKHLLNYIGTQPGNSEQDIFYRIYRMEKGPAQEQGKKVIRSLIKLGYNPSRGELSTMSQIDQDYECLYSYIKTGPSPLKDLCVRKIRESLPINVMYSTERWNIPEKEKSQILLLPLPLPEHDYENVQLRRDKEERKSKRKTLMAFMNNITRLSKRFNRKDSEKKKRAQSEVVNGSPLLAGKKDKKGESKLVTQKPIPVKPPPNPKPVYLKNQKAKNDLREVKQIIKQYSNSETSLASSSSKEGLSSRDDSHSNLIAINQAFSKDEDVEPVVRFDSHQNANHASIITIDDEASNSQQLAETIVVSFSHQEKVQSTIGPRLTPMKEHAPDVIKKELTLCNSVSIDT